MSVLKSLFAVSLTGASGIGGTLIYQSAVPGSWKDVLIKEGYYLLEKDNYYKAIYEDQKDKVIKGVSDLSSLNSDNAHSQIKTWCETALPKPYSGKQSDRNNMVNLCTLDGIVTVKARLISLGYTSFIIDLETGKQDKQYKIIFNIYRYLDRFIKWMQRTTTVANEYSSSTDVNTGFLTLKNACETELKKPHKRNDDVRYYKHLSWWCQKVDYENFEELAKKRKPGWETDEEAVNKGIPWMDTETVTKYMLSSSEDGKKHVLSDDQVKTWCSNNKNTSLDNGENYQEKFIVFLTVCEKTTSPSSSN